MKSRFQKSNQPGDLDFLLGVKSTKLILLGLQTICTGKTLKKIDMENCKSVAALVDISLLLTKDVEDSKYVEAKYQDH